MLMRMMVPLLLSDLMMKYSPVNLLAYLGGAEVLYLNDEIFAREFFLFSFTQQEGERNLPPFF